MPGKSEYEDFEDFLSSSRCRVAYRDATDDNDNDSSMMRWLAFSLGPDRLDFSPGKWNERSDEPVPSTSRVSCPGHGAVGGDGGDDENDKEKEEEAERERQEAIREAEERRKEKHRKMEEEREKMRQEIRDKQVKNSSAQAAAPVRPEHRTMTQMMDPPTSSSSSSSSSSLP
uniref:Uncharacterized protein n=1 Tax=Anopheles darlingi TaxID=43151 RepID=W5J3X4_ANODA|nr:hypothetical protein AND_009826 [Anopheles darlingi]